MEWAWLIPLYGVAAFAALALFRHLLPGQGKWLAVLAIFAGFVTFWPVLLDMVGRDGDLFHFPREWFNVGGFSIGWGVIVDPLTIVMLALVTFVALLVQVYSLGYMRHGHGAHASDDPRVGWYFAAHSLFAAAMLALVLADNLLVLYVAWELVGLCSYLLIGFWYERRSAAEAAKKAFITTRIGDVGLLIGILLLVVEGGTFDILELMSTLGTMNETIVTASAFLIFLGAMGKSAQFPLHVWLPDAMEGPTPVSALIHAATMVTAGVFLVARLFPLYDAVASAQLFIAIIGTVTAFMGATMALVSTDLKRILAYSTMSHLGFMMLALGAGAYTAAIFHLLTHGIAKAMLFMAAGSVMHAMHDETDIRKMGGLRKRMPITAGAFTIGALSLAGLAPLSAYWSKDEILLAVADMNPAFLVVFLGLIVLSALYMARAILLAFFGPLPKENEAVHESPAVMTLPLAVLGALTLVMGLLVFPLGDFGGIGTFLYDQIHGPHAFEFTIWAAVGLALALGGLGLGWLLYQGGAKRSLDGMRERYAGAHRLVAERYFMDHGYQWLIDQVFLRLGRIVAVFDRKVVNDGAVDSSGLVTMGAGRRVRMHVTGLFADYGLAMVAGVVVLTLILWLGR
ncbi:MAG: NADH-quinone oxidoreductase subunit L [Dehalococcoidia bacterium]